MELFIGNLPLDISVGELRKLLGDAGRKPRYRIQKKTFRDGTTRCYGQVVVEPDDVARTLIEKLNDTLHREQRLVVRSFVERHYTNDRRARLWSGKPWSGLDRRKGDRRS